MISSGAKLELRNNPNYYFSLLLNYSSNSHNTLNESKIDNDICRTFPLDSYYSDINIQNKMKNILIAYSRRNNTIGYCQGFNFIVGFLLKYFKDEVN